MEKKQTAVEWYIEQHNALLKLYNDSNMTALDLALAEDKLKFRAKQMEKEQSISDYCEGFKASGQGWNGEYGLNDILNVAEEIEAEKYYQETYGETKN